MKVKICGITSYDDARSALDAGAWALGFVLHRPSRRFASPERIADIVRRLPRDSVTVGVFVDYPLEELNAIVREAGLRGAQLHGEEGEEYAARVEAEVVIKAFRVEEGFDLKRLEGYPRQRVLLDAYHPVEAGGTGTAFDWRLAREAGKLRPIILAGGIHPGNAAECIEAARPDAIDVSSGVESAPGVKDRGRIARLFEAIEAASREGV